MKGEQAGQLITIVSARSDGATSLALALAAVLAVKKRTVLVDLNPNNPEVAAFLDADESKTVYHLAYNAQLTAVTDAELHEHLQWRDGFAVLPGITDPRQWEQITPLFIGNLLQVARTEFEAVVVDAGRLRHALPALLKSDTVLWLAAPRPLGLAAFEHAYRSVDDVTHAELRVEVVLNRVSPSALADVARFIRSEYGLPVVGELPDCTDFWSRAELAHSVRALSTPLVDRQRALRSYGDEVFQMREAVEVLVARVAQPAMARART